MFAKRIAALRKHLPDTLSVRELERLAHVRRGALQRILEGKIKNPGAATVDALAGLFGCSTDYLIRGTDPPSRATVIAAIKAAQAAQAAA